MYPPWKKDIPLYTASADLSIPTSVLHEERLEGPVDHLGNGQAVQVCLASDGLDPAAFDMEGDALGLLGGIAGLRGEVYPAPDLAAGPTSPAPIPAVPVDIRCTLGRL